MKRLSTSGRYVSVLFSAVFLLASVCTMTGCKNHSSGELACGGTFATDSVMYNNSLGDRIECAVKVDYPTEENDLSAAVRAYISDELKKAVIPDCAADSAGAQSYNGEISDGQNFVDFYGKALYSYLEGIVKEAGEEWQPHLTYYVDIRKSDENSRYITYRTKSYCYLGGAHGASTDYSRNISKESGEVVAQTVDTSATAELQPILRKGVLSYLNRNSEEQIPEEKLTEHIPFIENGIIPLPAVQPYLTKEGLHFIYGQYEIGPYAIGMVEFTVPSDEIRQYLTPQALKLLGK